MIVGYDPFSQAFPSWDIPRYPIPIHSPVASSQASSSANFSAHWGEWSARKGQGTSKGSPPGIEVFVPKDPHAMEQNQKIHGFLMDLDGLNGKNDGFWWKKCLMENEVWKV